MLAATVSAVLIGRRLGGPILAAALMFSAALAALAFGLGLAGTVALLAVAGAGDSLLDVAIRTLLQRSVPPQLIGRVFGVLEGLTMAGYALGALLVPLLVHLGGSRLALLGVAAVLPLAAVAGGRALFGLDAGTPVPVVEIALLRSLPLFAELPAPAIEGLAAALTPVQLPAGAVLIRQGDPGDAYYAIAAGELDALAGRAFPAPVRARRGSRRDRAAARHPAHGDRDRPFRRHRVRAQPGAFPDGGARTCPDPTAGGPHRRRAAGQRHRPGHPGHGCGHGHGHGRVKATLTRLWWRSNRTKPGRALFLMVRL